MRRFAAVMNHRSAGFKANAMGVWAVPDDELDEIGPRMAGFALVSHCYRRPTYEDWPYSVFTMVHGKNARECEQTIAAIQAETGVDEYALLWSIKEYKKTRVQYFTPDWDEWSDRARRLSAPVLLRAGLSSRAAVTPGREHRRHPRSHRPRTLLHACVDAAQAMPRRLEDRLLVRVLGLPAERAQPVVRDHPRVHEVRHDTRWDLTDAQRPRRAQHTRSSVDARIRGHRPTGGSSARSVVVREPAVGRDVERARVVLADHELERGDEVVDVDGLHRRRRAAHAQRGRPSSNRDGSRSAPGPSTGAVRSVVTTAPGCASRHSPSRRSASAAWIAGEKPGFGRSGASSVSGTGFVGPRAVDRRARHPDDLADATAAAASSTRPGAVDIDPGHQRLVGHGIDHRREVHEHVGPGQHGARGRCRAMSTRRTSTPRTRRRGLADVEGDDPANRQPGGAGAAGRSSPAAP